MDPQSLLSQLECLCAELDSPTADDTAGRLSALRYEVLPAFLVNERLTVLKSLRQYCQKDTQLELNTLQFETCKHGTPFRYECDECVAEIEP